MMLRLAVAAMLLSGTAALAHDGHVHGGTAAVGDRPALIPDAAATTGPAAPLPVDLGGPFTLTDQDGASRTEADPDGRMQLLFFGYAHCESICLTALPNMAETAQILSQRGIQTRPVMITVDPARDTPEALGAALLRFHPDFVGLTGDAEALAVAYGNYQIDTQQLFVDPRSGPVYAHGGFIYLLDGNGRFLTLVPPVLSPDRMADLVARYVAGS